VTSRCEPGRKKNATIPSTTELNRPRPRVDHANRLGHLPEADKKRIFGFLVRLRRLQFFARRRSGRRHAARHPWRRRSRARYRRAPADHAPLLGAVDAELGNESGLASAASCPVCLPSAAASPSNQADRRRSERLRRARGRNRRAPDTSLGDDWPSIAPAMQP